MSRKHRLILALVCLSMSCQLSTKTAVQQHIASSGKWRKHGIVDIHGHIGMFKGYDLTVATLLKNIEVYGIDQVLISNIDGARLPGTTLNLGERAANLATVDTIRQYSKTLRGVLWTRPGSGGDARIIENFLAADEFRNLFVAMKLHPEMNQFPADSSIVNPYLQLCEKYEIPAVFHSGGPGANSDPERIYAAAKRFPTVAVILYHMGFGGDHDHAIATVKMALARGDANLYLGTAQASPQAVMKAISELGSKRVLFGTDATYYGMNHYSKYEELIEDLMKNLSEGEFSDVVRKNALNLFSLGPS